MTVIRQLGGVARAVGLTVARVVVGLVLLLVSVTAGAQLSFPPPPSPLVSGNGYGYAVYSLKEEALTKLYAHPYRFVRPDPRDRFGEGIETTQFLRRLEWLDGRESPQATSAPRVSVTGAGASVAADFVAQSHVIGRGENERHFMPFGLARNALVTTHRLKGERLKISWAHPVAATTPIFYRSRRGKLFEFKGQLESVALVPLDGRGTWALIVLERKSELRRALSETSNWQGKRDGTALVERELREIEQWRSQRPPKFETDGERRLWRQSEVILRMSQSREKNTRERFGHGFMVASLPEGMWFVAWARDMALATIALIRSGHQAEARAALSAYFDARRTGLMTEQTRGYPYQISTVRYFGDGTEEPFFTMEGAPNVELDDWGLVLWALSEYVEKFHDVEFLARGSARGTVYESARDFIARPLIGNLDPFQNGWIAASDTSIWEERQEDRKHFAFSTAAAFNGLARFAALARLMNDEPQFAHLERYARLVRDGFHRAFTDRGYVRGTLEPGLKNDIDAAVVDALNWGLVTDPGLIEGTRAKMELLRMPTGGFRRVRGETEYEKHEFLYANFSMARAYLREGNRAAADALVAPMVEAALKDHGLIPEMYISQPSDDFKGEVGEPTGSIPMVGYGAGIYLIYLLERGT